MLRESLGLSTQDQFSELATAWGPVVDVGFDDPAVARGQINAWMAFRLYCDERAGHGREYGCAGIIPNALIYLPSGVSEGNPLAELLLKCERLLRAVARGSQRSVSDLHAEFFADTAAP